MTQKIKGEVAITAESGPLAGDYTLVLDLNALCDLEDDFPEIMQGNIHFEGLKSVRKLFHKGLERYHPELSQEDAGSILHAIGLDVGSNKIAETMKVAFPEAKEDANPRKAPAKAGAGSGR